MVSVWTWVAFHAAVLIMLAMDLGLAGRSPGARRHAAAWSALWIALALGFGVFVKLRFGGAAATEYYAAYLLEKSLSLDNLFVFVLIFGALGIAPEHRHRILLWGVLGALVMRGAMIAVGGALVARFDWVLYAFGVFLIVTGWRMWFQPSHRPPEVGRAVRVLSRLLPIEQHDVTGRFVVRRESRQPSWAGTPLLLALILVEAADLAFALDSIPAVFAITRDPFIVYTSNVMAVLGLRALFLLLSDGLERLRYLRHGLAGILVFIGTKMLVVEWWHVPVTLSLAVIVTILAFALAASLGAVRRRRDPPTAVAGNHAPEVAGKTAARFLVPRPWDSVMGLQRPLVIHSASMPPQTEDLASDGSGAVSPQCPGETSKPGSASRARRLRLNPRGRSHRYAVRPRKRRS